MKTIILWNEQDIKDYESKIGRKLIPVNELVEHQKKVIDRLSRKIQRLNKEKRIIGLSRQHYKLLALTHYPGVDIKYKERISKALNYIQNNLSWAVGSEDLIKILEGKDE